MLDPLYLGLPMTAVLLLGAHFVADYPLQGQFLAEAKNPAKPVPGVPWPQAMTAHCAIHGTFVALITGVWWLALLEFGAHFATDVQKCRGRLSFNEDQLIHVACKVTILAVTWRLATHAGP